MLPSCELMAAPDAASGSPKPLATTIISLLACCRSCRLRFGDEDAVRIAILPNRIDADVTLLIQRIFDHFWSEDHAIPGQAEPVRLDRLARNRMAVLIVAARPRIP